jgi:hypothetical protein
MPQTLSETCAFADNVSLARECLRLISEIANRGALSEDPDQISYALQELTQVLYERTGHDDRIFEPIAPNRIDGLQELYAELDLVNCFSQGMAVARLN